jgi:hypothetical protein
MAVLALPLLIFLVGLWEVARYVMVQNLLDSAAREAARQAASGSYFSSGNHLSPVAPNPTVTLPTPSSNGNYEVQQRALLYLQLAGVNTTGATITVANSGPSAGTTTVGTPVPKSWSSTWTQSGSAPSNGSGTWTGYDPSAVADQLDQITVTVTLPYKNINWSTLGWFISTSTTMTATVSWDSVRDYPLIVSTTIPSKPLQPSDPLP